MASIAETRYLKSHEWARLEESGEVCVGISNHAVDLFNKEIVFVELPEVGRTVKSGESFGVVESVKAAADVYAPVAGTITAVNAPVADDPATLGEDPEGSAWLIKLQPANAAELDTLLSADDYVKLVESEGSH